MNILALLPLMLLSATPALDYFSPYMGTGKSGYVSPVASMPYGMVEMATDTDDSGTGYKYAHDSTFGFSHQHKSGSGGGSDYLDILFLPVDGEEWAGKDSLDYQYKTTFSHEKEWCEPGYYAVELPELHVKAELSASPRCGVHKYSYGTEVARKGLYINLEHGNRSNCTIYPEDCYDTVKVAYLEKVNRHTIRGYRISNGWCPEQHVYFYARFSKPVDDIVFFDKMHRKEGKVRSLQGQDVRAVVTFADEDGEPLEISVGISAVDMAGARKNYRAEVRGRSFSEVRESALAAWEKELSALEVSGSDEEHLKTLYTCFYQSHLYPCLYSDVDGRYRSSDKLVHKGRFRYFAGVLGLWDTFRAQLPLTGIMHPDITLDLMKTFQAHFDNCGQLPIWTLAGQENMCMIGYHAMPVIADAYAQGVREGYDAQKLLDAMTTSACRDTFGFFLRQYRGATNYRELHYVPFDREISSASKTLEYAYDDWCIAQMARMLGRKEVEQEYLERSQWYRNVFDPSVNSMRGRKSDGSWREPFDPFLSNHWQENDDFTEGNAWQWNFFVPHDGAGLISLFGGQEGFISKLDSLFIVSSELHGANPSGDITGLIGQYAHGNEPSHHTIYMYNYAGQPWKTQQRITQVVNTFYNSGIDGICGDEDTGQMSSWYVLSSIGVYPVTHGTGIYFIGAPQQEHLVLKHGRGTLVVDAPGFSKENFYIQSARLNGEPFTKNYLTHAEIFEGDAHLEFEMGPEPNQAWGSSAADIPPSTF